MASNRFAGLNESLRRGTLGKARTVLAETLTSTGPASMTAHLLLSIESGSVQPVFPVYFGVNKDIVVAQAALTQTFSASTRGAALSSLGCRLVSESSFDETWEALGGAEGTANLLQILSVNEVDRFCRSLALSPRDNTSTAFNERRKKVISELFSFLVGFNGNIRDSRPLEQSYLHLLPRCTNEIRERWERQTCGWIKSQTVPKPYYPSYLEPDQTIPAEIADQIIVPLTSLEGLHREHKKTLTRVAECNGLRIKPAEFLDQLLLHMARRMAKQKLPEGARSKMWAIIIASLERWPEITRHKDSEGRLRSLFKLAVQWWNYAPTGQKHRDAEDALLYLLRLLPESIPNLTSIAGFLVGTRSRKYDLVRMCVHQSWGIDLESIGGQDHETLAKSLKNDYVEAALFRQLPAAQALSLLDFLAKARPDKAFLRPMHHCNWGKVQYERTVLSQLAKSSESHADFDILRYLLLSVLGPLSSEARVSAEDAIKLRTTEANKSREPHDRIFWAKSALFLSIATGCPDLYSKTLLWARRFDRDHHVVSTLYLDLLQAREGIVLLCAIPTAARLPVASVAEVEEEIKAGNRIILQFLDAAGDGIQQPHFTQYTWSQVGSLASDVVKMRFELVNAFQDHHGLSDGQVYDSVWKPTLEMLYTAEEFTLREEHEPLGFARQRGLLDRFTLDGLRDHAWKFLDDLACIRNELWRNERLKRSPAVLSLKPPLPAGLPVHSLCQFDFREGPFKLPYVASRAEDIVFANPATLFSPMPTDGETRGVIGHFIDDFSECVWIYVNGGSSQVRDRQARIDRVRCQLMELGRGRMSEDEAHNFWQSNIFDSLAPYLSAFRKPNPVSKPDLAFPRVDDALEPMEWFPDPTWRNVKGSQRMVPGALSYLECLLGRKGQETLQSSNRAFEPYPLPYKMTLEVPSSSSFWDCGTHVRPLSGETQDVHIAAAMLAINSRAGSDASLLMRPFPSEFDVRFPAVYLADEFLEGVVDGDPAALQACFDILKKYQARVPPQLLLQLALSMLQKLRKVERTPPDHRRLTMEVVSLVSRGERPSNSFGIIRDIIIDGQGDSSWHRHLFNVGFFEDLPAAEAITFSQGIADLIVERLRAQAERKAAGEEETVQAPYVKVTTVKMLAQMLNGARHIGPGNALAILTNILADTTHPDIKEAVIASIVQIFRSSASARDTRDQALSILAEYAVPIAASVDEREIISEDDWAEIGATGELPEVKNSWSRPVYQLLLGTYVQDEENGEHWKQRWQSEIIGPLLDLSMVNNRRWFDVFLRKYKLGTAEWLPAVPLLPDLFHPFLAERFELMESWVFKAITEYCLVSLFSPEIERINNTLKANPRHVPHHALQHWDNVFGRVSNPGTFVQSSAALLRMPASVWEKAAERGITVPLIRDFITTVAEYYLDRDEVDSFIQIITTLSRMPVKNRDTRESWLANALPLISQLCDKVVALRTPAWQNNVNRSPRRLPDEFRIRLYMLVFPSTQFDSNTEPAPQDEIAAFAGQIKVLVYGLVNRGIPYHTNWDLLGANMMSDSLSKTDYLRVALALVEDSGATLADHLLVGLAMQLVRDGEDPKDDTVVKATRELLIGRWKGGSVEEFREAAQNIITHLSMKRGAAKSWARGSYRDKFEEANGEGSFLDVGVTNAVDPMEWD
ncbi:hypothetical protein OQA88_1860 [Cercophora sp. LCS_1]